MIHEITSPKRKGNTVLRGSVSSYNLGKIYWKTCFTSGSGGGDQTQFILFIFLFIK